MNQIFKCRRSIIAIFAICCLTFLGVYNSSDVAMAIATVATGLAAANSYEKSKTSPKAKKDGSSEVEVDNPDA